MARVLTILLIVSFTSDVQLHSILEEMFVLSTIRTLHTPFLLRCHVLFSSPFHGWLKVEGEAEF